MPKNSFMAMYVAMELDRGGSKTAELLQALATSCPMQIPSSIP